MKEEIRFQNNEFFEPPTTSIVLEFLCLQPPTYSVHIKDFAPYVIALPQTRNVNLDPKGNPDYKTVWSLYVSVAGRIAMFCKDMENRKLIGNFVPEKDVPQGNPSGYLQIDENRIVYREYCEIYKESPDGDLVLVGRRPGTSWVPATGGSGAVRTNRFENVETSARGRALAAWGYGVLPASGVASLEEMQRVSQLVEEKKPTKPAKREKSELIQELELILEQLRLAKGVNEEEASKGIVEFVQRHFKKDISTKGFGVLKEGEILLLVSKCRGELNKLLDKQTMERERGEM